MIKFLVRPQILLVVSVILAIYFVLLGIYSYGQQELAILNFVGEILTIPMLILAAIVLVFSAICLIRPNVAQSRVPCVVSLLISISIFVMLFFYE